MLGERKRLHFVVLADLCYSLYMVNFACGTDISLDNFLIMKYTVFDIYV